MRNKFSAKQLAMSSLLLGASLLPVPAHADRTGGLWMLLGDGDKLEAGVAPNRVMHFAYPADIRDLTDQNAKIAEIMRDANPKTIDARIKAMEVKEMDVIQIFEHPSAPGFKMLTMQFQCTKKLYRVAKTQWKERNSLHRFGGGTEWQTYVPTDWQSRAYFVACFTEVWGPMARAEMKEMAQPRVGKQGQLREYGVGLIGAWTKDEGINQVYRLTWDKIWAGSATPIPFHHNRNAAEEAEYQAWKKGNDATIAGNIKAAPMIEGAIASLEGDLKGQEAERAFIMEVNRTFKAKSKTAFKVFFGTEGFTEKEIVARWGAPKNVRDYAGTRFVEYSKQFDTRRTETSYIKNVVVGSGGGVDPGYSEVKTETGSVFTCTMTLHLKPGGSKPGYRLIDYQGDLCVWDTSGF